MEEAEPWRCRRTDGKKWRCKKEVIPNEKYCETHMHRGCRRSRKLVESSSSSSSSNNDNNKLTLPPTSCTTNTNHSSSSKKNPPSVIIKLNQPLGHSNKSRLSNLAITPKSSSSPLSLQLKIQPPNGTASSHYEHIAVARVKDGMNKGSLDDCDTPTKNRPGAKIEIKSALLPPSPAVSASAGEEHFNLSKKSRVMVKGGGGDGTSCGKVEENVTDESTKSKNRNGVTASSTLDFSPKSVLQDGHQVSSLLLNQKKATDSHMLQSDSRRCRRTDGKRWRCGKEVVASDQKYCAKHMHRGAKKRPFVMVASSSPYGTTNISGCGDKSEPAKSCDLRLCNGFNTD